MEKKTKIIATVGVIAVVAFFGYKWYSKRKNKKVLASKPVTTPTKTAGADGDDDDSNASGVPRYYVAPTVSAKKQNARNMAIDKRNEEVAKWRRS